MRRCGKAVAIAVAVAAVTCASALADAPLWRTVDREFAKFTIEADRRIVRDPRLAFILQDRLRSAEKAVASEDEFVRKEKANEPNRVLNKGSHKESFHLLGITKRYAAILVQTTMCPAGARYCSSGDYPTIYRLSDRARFTSVDALELEAQVALWRRLIERDYETAMSEFGSRCDERTDHGADDERCMTLGGLNVHPEDFEPADLKNRVSGVGFTTDATGRVNTLDVYISLHMSGGYHRTYRWPIAITDAAPLLKPALRDDLLATQSRSRR